MCMYVRMYFYTSVHIYVCMHVPMYVRMYCMYSCICMLTSVCVCCRILLTRLESVQVAQLCFLLCCCQHAPRGGGGGGGGRLSGTVRPEEAVCRLCSVSPDQAQYHCSARPGLAHHKVLAEGRRPIHGPGGWGSEVHTDLVKLEDKYVVNLKEFLT